LVGGLPVVYFFRDQVGLAPNNALFTALGLFFPYFATLVFRKNYSVLQKPNPVSFLIFMVFFFYILMFLILADRWRGIRFSQEMSVFAIISIVLCTLWFLKPDLHYKNFIRFGLVFSFLGCLALVYGIATDPLYALGQRAAVNMGDEKNVAANPHIYGRNAFITVTFALMALKHRKLVGWGFVFPLIIFLSSIAILIMTQTFVSLVSLCMMLFLFFIYNFSFIGVFKGFKKLMFKWYFLIGLCFIGYQAKVIYDKYEDGISIFYDQIGIRVKNLTGTLFGDKKEKKKKVKVDESANERIVVLGKTIKAWDKESKNGELRYLIFGHGYRTRYNDIPMLESYDSFGLMGLFLYGLLTLYLLKSCLQEMALPESPMTDFFAYAFCYSFCSNFMGGLVVDYTRLVFIILVIRFVRNRMYRPGFIQSLTYK
jgi:hypothetical protein